MCHYMNIDTSASQLKPFKLYLWYQIKYLNIR